MYGITTGMLFFPSCRQYHESDSGKANLEVNFVFSVFCHSGVYSGWGASLAVNLETFGITQVNHIGH